MVAAYSDRLRLTEQGTGDNPNTWGTVLNDQVIALLDTAVAGVVDVDITGSSNVTLTTANGSEDEARNAVLELTGVLGANIDLLVPAEEKIYFIRGDWTGGNTITVKISGSATDIDMVTGDLIICYTNGTDIYNVTQAALLITNNLSDLNDASAARTNLGLGTLAVLGAGTGLSISGGNLNVTVTNALVGEGKMWYTASAPSGWLIVDGTAVSRTTYSALFAVIGTTYGVGDGATTFNLPNGKARSPMGAGQGATEEGDTTGTDRVLGILDGYENHTQTIAEMPAHTHPYEDPGPVEVSSTGSATTANEHATTEDTGSTGGGDAHNNQSPVFVCNFIIFTGV